MSFIVPAMAFGAVAALIPIIIHLLNRTRYRVVRWGAMHLLDSVVRVNRRRIRIEQLILLAIRAAIPAAIALFMAKPVLTGWQNLPGDVKRSVVVALDDSYSMEAGGGDQSSFAAARRALGDIVSGLERGSDVALLRMGGAASEGPTLNLSALGTRIRDLQGGYGRADAPASIEAGLARFADMGNADRELVLLSDFQRTSWGRDEEPALRRSAALIAEMPVKPRVTLWPIGADGTENLCVESIACSRSIVGVAQRVQVKATIRNHGSRAYAGLRAHFRVDGTEREASEIAVGAGERSQVIFSHAFDAPGSHWVEVTVDADPLAADNSLAAAIPVWDSVPVLIVTGGTSREPLKGETDFLEIALAPFKAASGDAAGAGVGGGAGIGSEGPGRSGLADLIRARTVEAGRIDEAALREARVAILADVPQLGSQETVLLDDFVRTGGGLLLFPGPRSDLGWYNAALGPAATGILAVSIAGVAGHPTDRARQTSVLGEHFGHEALALFNVPENGTVAGGEVRLWWRAEAPRDAAGVATLARLASGDPFLLEWALGEGRAILCATTCDSDWGNLPLRASYVPLVQELVTYLASTVYPPRNVEVGNELALFLPPSKAGTRLAVLLPDGTERRIEAAAKGPRAVAAFAETRRPGLYVMRAGAMRAGVMQAGAMQPGVTQTDATPADVHFIVSTSREESNIETLSGDEIAEVATLLGADVVRSSAEYDDLQSRRHHGREIWRHVFWAALALIFLELLLEQLFARKRGGKNAA
jgi:hypothetical protein